MAASMTKGQIRTAVRQAIDDPQSKRWSDANLDVLITLVWDTLFQALNDTFDTYTLTENTATTDGAGRHCCYYPFGSYNLYRFIRVTRTSDGAELLPKLPTDNIPGSLWYFHANGNLNTGLLTTGVTIQYSYVPTRFVDLATDATNLPPEYPAGHESALIYVAASWALTKGDAESMAQVARVADMAVDIMVTHIARRYPIAPNMRLNAIKNAIMRIPLVSSTSTVG